MRDTELVAGAKKIAEALKSPGGQIALARVVARHIAWFDLARERGLSWDQMIAVLHAAGGSQADGMPFSRGHLSSAVWRARKKNVDGGNARGGDAVQLREGSPVSGLDKFREQRKRDRKGRPTLAKTDGVGEVGPATSSVQPADGPGRSALDFMRRAAERRRGRTE